MIETFSKLLNILHNHIAKVVEEEGGSLERASDYIAKALENGGFEYVFGTGHSMLVALEVFFRAGGLVRVYPIIDLTLLGIPSAVRASMVEKLPNYARGLVESTPIIPNSVLVVVSNSGKNAVPVELAYYFKERGVKVVAITSVKYSMALKPENSLGKKLYEIADVVIDNKIPEGDVTYVVSDEVKTFPISTIVNSFILHAINVRAMEKLLEKGIMPEVWTSVNVPGGSERNREYVSKYRTLVKYL